MQTFVFHERCSMSGSRRKKSNPLPFIVATAVIIAVLGFALLNREGNQPSDPDGFNPVNQPQGGEAAENTSEKQPVSEFEKERPKTEAKPQPPREPDKPAVKKPVKTQPAQSTKAGTGAAYSGPLPDGVIWGEGEDANENNVKPHSWFTGTVKTEPLSGGALAGNWSGEPGILGYNINVKKSGSYKFWVRANPGTGARLSYQINGGGWNLIDMNADVRGRINLAKDNKPDLRYIAWIKVGKIELNRGMMKLEFKMDSKNNNFGYLDCFCMTMIPFTPSGAMKPGAITGAVASKPAGPDKAIWIEGEDPDSSNNKPHSWYDSVKKDVFSDGQWLSHFDGSKKEQPVATYSFEVIEPDTYVFWVRANPSHTALSYKLDTGDWVSIDTEKDVRGLINIAADNKPDLRYIGWMKAGSVKLEKGKHEVKIRFDSENSYHGGLDCMTFVRIPWAPSGASKPAIQVASTDPAAWFPFMPDDDEFSKDSVTDMSRLIPAPAGQFGFLKRDGEHLKFENADKPVKFWAVGAGAQQEPADMEQAAKFFRKYGINLTRLHTVLGVTGLMDKNGEFEKGRLDRLDRHFAAMKKQGIYSTWSVFYPHHGPFLQKHDGLDEEVWNDLKKSKGGIAHASDYVNFSRPIQDVMYKYVKKLLEHKNPYTGLAYRDDPALAIIEVQNESCAFWGDISAMFLNKEKKNLARRVGKMFFDWTKNKYGTKEAVLEAWGGFRPKDQYMQDDWDNGILAVTPAYAMGAEGPLYQFSGQFRRVGDFINFCADVQREYYQRRKREYREIGFKGCVVTTAWKAGGAAASLANLYSDDAGDIIDRHNYFGGGDGGHRITEGKVSNATHLSQPGRGLMNLGLFQIAGKPFTVSEWSMMPPAPYKAEAAPLYAFYGLGLQGWDISYHFATGKKRFGSGWPGLGKYCSHTPHYMGQFPALAFAVYNNHIKEGAVVAKRVVTDKMMYSAKDELGQAISAGSHDQKVLGKNVKTPPECIAIGKVTIEYSDAQPELDQLGLYWDQGTKQIRSNTGQLQWDYGNRIVQVMTKKTQAVIGFAQGREFDLPGVTVSEVKTPFMSLIFTPLDNLDLDQSKHILVTAMARDKQTGSVFNDDWSRLEVVGGPPLLLEPVQATLKLKGDEPSVVRTLDIYGVPTSREVKIEGDGSFRINGLYSTYYYEIRR